MTSASGSVGSGPPERGFQPQARLAAERVGLVFLGLVIGQGRDVDDPPPGAVLRGLQAAREVVLVPPGVVAYQPAGDEVLGSVNL